MKTNLKLNLDDFYDEAHGEQDLISYFVKLYLREYKIPVILQPKNIAWQPFEVETGTLDWRVDVETMTMEFEYVA
ncbi:hypothetical protein OFDDKENP_00120 [Aeromonas phage B614]|nr:hypothetical protein OFDDKENP_00120 [Aeromonas phage B614]UYD58153.1 hypothetical protein JNEOFJEA_00056 [Aeromonas phage UP87]UYD58516.1 hypothetical protein IPAKJDPM_00173 [Aeromonas phage avDM14-QBC]UYD58731.1 hypothetical protein HNNIDBEH_00138 [Aeromonas phage avDM10-HWA]UYD58965.1 hypothetical protein OFOPOMKI_00115 [Aeromonas phage avDM7-IJDJ]UYD59776.1 hypothetical protein LEHPIFIF_00003 [Aeromonas phage avDM9-HANS]